MVRRWLAFGAGLGLGLLLWLAVLPWAGRNGWAGPVVRHNFEQDRDASALFYSESDRVWELSRHHRLRPDEGLPPPNVCLSVDTGKSTAIH